MPKTNKAMRIRLICLAAGLLASSGQIGAVQPPVELRYQGQCAASGFQDYVLTECGDAMSSVVLKDKGGERGTFNFSIGRAPFAISGVLNGMTLQVDSVAFKKKRQAASGICNIDGEPMQRALFVCNFSFDGSPRRQIAYISSGKPEKKNP